ncbi:MAG: DUF2188 domain-containing protein [Candidatus Bathyarchaeota archaeon]|nr:DUF2188 domain-containing protein [Candidatus Termiticorpusculum sp.]
MSRKEHHVVPNGDGWSVKRAGATRASVNANTKAEAVRIGHVISQRQGSNLRIHGKDGRIQSAKKPVNSSRRKR